MAAAAVALSAAPTASANSTLTVMSAASRPDLRITAIAGKENDFAVQVGSNTISITDPGDPIDESAAECSGGGTNTVSCAFPAPIGAVTLDAADLDDSIRADAPQGVVGVFGLLVLIGGDGGDEITVTAPPGAPGATSLSGDDGFDPAGDGPDTITGSSLGDGIAGHGGVDVLLGGEGDDFLTPGPGDMERAEGGPGDDVVGWHPGDGTGDQLNGGDGVDTLFSFDFGTSLSQGLTALNVDLAAGTLVQTGGGSAAVSAAGLEGFEGEGSTFTVNGTDGPNTLLTGSSDDVLNPRSGPDRVASGAGGDRVTARDGFADRIECGPGADTVEVDQFDELFGCETVDAAQVLPAGLEFDAPVCQVSGVRRRMPRRRFLARGVGPQIECNEAVELETQLTVGVRRRRGELVTVRAGELVLAERALPFSVDARRVTLKVPRRLRRVLGRRFVARLTVVARDQFGNRGGLTRTVRVR